MLVTYNNVQLRMTRVVLWDHRPVYDESNTDYTTTHVRFGVECWYNPKATTAAGGPGVAPHGPGANVAGYTIAQLRHALTQPRKRLAITDAYGNVVLDSFGSVENKSAECDARGGPKPSESIKVLEIRGDRTAKVYFEIETWLNDCKDRAKAPLLAHRWTTHHEIDEDRYTTVVTDGFAVFSKAALLHSNLVPDEFRWYLLPEVPLAFRRTLSLSEAPDGLTFRYQCRDSAQPRIVIENEANIVRFRGKYHVGWSQTESIYATRREHLHIEVRGSPDGAQPTMVDDVLRVADAFGFNLTPTEMLGGLILPYAVDLQVDLWDRAVSLDAAWIAKPSSILGVSTPSPAGVLGRNMRNKALAAARFRDPLLISQWEFLNPDNPDWVTVGHRGTYAGGILTAALLGECKRPAGGAAPIGLTQLEESEVK